MSAPRDTYAEFLEAAGEAQLRMQIERGFILIERYLAGHAEFAAWCRVNLSHLAEDRRPPDP
jgi:hypothetical protein